MRIRDFGCGLAADVLERFNTSGSNLGVGLVGMRERVHELGGDFNIHSDAEGTTLAVQIPLTTASKIVA
jgi:signal transduction histidine kinase